MQHPRAGRKPHWFSITLSEARRRGYRKAASVSLVGGGNGLEP